MDPVLRDFLAAATSFLTAATAVLVLWLGFLQRRMKTELKTEVGQKAQEGAAVGARTGAELAVTTQTPKVATAVANKVVPVVEEGNRKTDAMYESLNGSGLSGMMKKVVQWQADHQKQDEEWHAEVMAELRKRPPERDPEVLTGET